MVGNKPIEDNQLTLGAYLGFLVAAWIIGVIVANIISPLYGSAYSEATVFVVIGFWAGKAVLKNKDRNWIGIASFPVIALIASLIGSSLGDVAELHSEKKISFSGLFVIVSAFLLSCGLFAVLNQRSNARERPAPEAAQDKSAQSAPAADKPSSPVQRDFHTKSHTEFQEASTVPEHFYSIAADEVDTGNIDKGLWTKLFVKLGGDELRVKIEYLETRSRRLYELSVSEGKGLDSSKASDKSINEYDANGRTPLMNAVLSADVWEVARLIQHGADIEVKDGNFGTSTALSMAQLSLRRSTSSSESEALKEIIMALERKRTENHS